MTPAPPLVMNSSHLYGLNVIMLEPLDSTSQDLLSGSFPDLSSWSHLPFESEDGVSTVKDNNRLGQMTEEYKEGRNVLGNEAEAICDSHGVKVVTGTTVVSNDCLLQTELVPPLEPSADMEASLLSSFGINPLVFVQQSQPVQQTSPSEIPLAQLSAIDVVKPSSPVAEFHPAHLLCPPKPAKRPISGRWTKRQRSLSEDPFSAIENKKRRNTAASARFRLKKKEQEMALENKTKELEARVGELDREYEGLWRENIWLKGLFVGATEAVQSQARA